MTTLQDFNAASPPPPGTLTKEGVYIGRFKEKFGKYDDSDRDVVKDWFADATDAQDKNGKRLYVDFNDAAQFAKKSTSLGHSDWILPPAGHKWIILPEGGRTREPDIIPDPRDKTPDILEAMEKLKNVGAFKGSYDQKYAEYRASNPDPRGDSRFSCARDFNSGYTCGAHRSYLLPVRAVRYIYAPTK